MSASNGNPNIHDTIGTTIDSGVTVGYITIGVGLLLLALGLGAPTLLAVLEVLGAEVLLPYRSNNRSGDGVLCIILI